jgi:hypothetical protein
MNPSDTDPHRTSDVAAIAELRGLEPIPAPPALWSAIASDLDQRAQSRARKRWAWMGSALAASLALVVALAVFQPSMDETRISSVAQAPNSSSELDQIRRLSAALEANLRDQQQGRVSTQALEDLVLMENELGWLDMRLAGQPGDLELWQRRVEILGDMNQLYSQNHWQNQMRLTSL